MLFADRVGPVGPDDELIEVADDQQRRVFQCQSILLQLPECRFEILALALVFPAEVTALPHVGPTVAAARLRGAALEAVEITSRIGLCRRRFPEQPAQIEKMLLRSRPLLQLNRAPFSDEVISCETTRQSHTILFAIL